MPERECNGCTRQDEWGCEAYQFRTPEKGEDPRDSWYKPAIIPLDLDGEEFYACPRQSLYREPREWSQLLMLYGFYQKGFLPDEGSLMSQSNSVIQAFRILDMANAECDNQKAVKDNRPKGNPLERR